MALLSYRAAAACALREELRRDPAVWALGEDLGRGGIFGQYRDLQAEFGSARVVDAPISESAIVGAGVGAALYGMRPVVEMRFSDFALCAIDELVNQAAKARFMSGGQARVPLVVREPIGIGSGYAAQHSQSLEAWYAHVPGLVVITPATPADLRGLLKAAIRCDDPVVFLEHKALWNSEGEVDLDSDGVVEIGKCRVARAGRHLTMVSWSAQLSVCLEAAERLVPEGIEVEVVDLRSLWPWDKEGVADSLRRTGRLLVVHEAVQVGGFGAEIAAWAAEEMHDALLAPVGRLGAPRSPTGFAESLEAEVRVSVTDVVERAQAIVAR